MASKSQVIPEEEWAAHKETIRRLYAQNTLTVVMKIMEEQHEFFATKSQYEAKLRYWDMRKNLKRKDWQRILKEQEDTHSQGVMTSSGLRKTDASIARARRWAIPDSGSSQENEALVSAQPSAALDRPVDSESQEVGNRWLHRLPPQSSSPDEIPHGKSLSRIMFSTTDGLDSHVTLSSSGTHSLRGPTDQPFSCISFGQGGDWQSSVLLPPCHPSSNNMGQFRTYNTFWPSFDVAGFPFGLGINPTGGNVFQPGSAPSSTDSALFNGTHISIHNGGYCERMEQIQGGSGGLAPPTTSVPGDCFNHVLAVQQPCWQSGSLDRISGPQPLLQSNNFPLLSSDTISGAENWLKDLPFAMFEGYLRCYGISLTGDNSSIQDWSGTSVSVCLASQSLLQRASGTHNGARRLGSLLPEETPTAMQNPPNTNLVKLLLYSLLNGFAGFTLVPMKDILDFLGSVGIMGSSLIGILKETPTHASKTVLDNIFRAAVEAVDLRVITPLLQLKLVDVNNSVCFYKGQRYTPVELAARLQALELIRILVKFGADINKSYMIDARGKMLGGALAQLLWAYPKGDRVLSTADLIDSVDLLLMKGSRVSMSLLGRVTRASRRPKEVVCRLARNIASADHEAFVERNSRYIWGNIPMLSIAAPWDDDVAAAIFRNMIEACERAGCESCSKSPAERFEDAAVEAARKGNLRLVQLLIHYVSFRDMILSAAIISDREDLITYVLSCQPELDPPARRSYFRIHELTITTPLAEAVRARNTNMITRLEMAGARRNLASGSRFEPLVAAAAAAGNMVILESMIELASISWDKYPIRSGAMLSALKEGHSQIATLLLTVGATTSNGLFSDEWLLFQAVRSRDTTLVRAVLEADISCPAGHGSLGEAIQWFKPSIISDLLFTFPDTLVSGDSLNLLCIRCMETGRVEYFRTFLEALHRRDELDLNRCLQSAVEMSHESMVQLLLQVGADPFQNHMLVAAVMNHPEMIPLLLPEEQRPRVLKTIGAKILRPIIVDNPENTGVLNNVLQMGVVNLSTPEPVENEQVPGALFTPLGLAIGGAPEVHLGIVETLLRAGSSPDEIARFPPQYVTRIGETALMVAIEKGREDLVQLLLTYGANVNRETYLCIKRTPLQHAAELGDLGMVRLLLRNGADANGKPATRSGGTALQFAAISGNCNIAAELLNHEARLDALPSRVNGRWPLEGAAEHGRLDMIQFLWRAKGLSCKDAGFEERHCLRAMRFARENGHIGCGDLIAELSGIAAERLDGDDYGAKWLAY